MQAFIIDRNDSWEATKGMKKVELPEPKLDEKNHPEHKEWVIVKVLRSGICGSDKSIWFRKAFGEAIYKSLERENKSQRIIGHEFFGEIAELGSEVTEKFGYKKGNTVSSESHIICDTCYQCLRGEKHVCTNEIILGIGIDGSHTNYLLLPAKVLWPTDPEKIRPEVAAIQEPFGNAVHAATEVDPKGQTILVLGTGTIGLMSIMIVKALKARLVIAADPNDNKLGIAKQYGADITIKTQRDIKEAFDEELVKKAVEATDGVGADIVLEMAGHNTSVNNAIKAVRRGGHVILFGLKTGDYIIKNYDKMIMRGIHLHCIIGRHIFKNWETTKALLEDESNGVQKHLWEDLLKKGEGTVLPFSTVTPEEVEKAITENTKVVLNMEK